MNKKGYLLSGGLILLGFFLIILGVSELFSLNVEGFGMIVGGVVLIGLSYGFRYITTPQVVEEKQDEISV